MKSRKPLFIIFHINGKSSILALLEDYQHSPKTIWLNKQNLLRSEICLMLLSQFVQVIFVLLLINLQLIHKLKIELIIIYSYSAKFMRFTDHSKAWQNNKVSWRKRKGDKRETGKKHQLNHGTTCRYLHSVPHLTSLLPCFHMIYLH